MKLSTLLEDKVPGPRKFGSNWVPKPHYQADRKIVGGPVALWMDKIGVTAADLEEARKEVMKLQSYKDLVKIAPEMTSDTQKKNGMFAFKKANTKSKNISAPAMFYSVAANGQIRYDEKKEVGASRGKLASPKPSLVAGSPVKSLIKIYDNSFKRVIELVEKGSK